MILPIRDLGAFPRCSVCDQLKAQERSPAPWSPVGPSAARRFPLAARFSELVWELGQSRQPLLWAHRQYLRLRSGSLETASGRGRKAMQPANEFLCDRHKAKRQHINLTLSLVCALSSRARVRLPRSPTAVVMGTRKKATHAQRPRRQTLSANRSRSLGNGTKVTNILPSCPRRSRVHLRPLVSAWKSSHQLLRQEQWAITHGVATKNNTSLSPTLSPAAFWLSL